MTDLTATLRQLHGERNAVPPFLDDTAEGMLSVARDLFEHPETVTIPNGRELGYAETGDPKGEPLLVFHGVPSGRLGAAVLDRVAREHGVRIIAPERPGVGVSDPASDRDLTDWPADAAALLDALGIDRAPVFGISGGPYALACGALASDCFPRIVVSCGIGPLAAVGFTDRLMFQAARYAPRAIGAFLRAEELAERYVPERTLERRAAAAAPRDRGLWRSEIGKVLVAAGPAARQYHGNASFVRDLQLYATDWGFDLGTIDVPVGLWYGRADRLVPVAMGQYLMEAIPTAEAHFYPDFGHLSTIVKNESAIIDWLGR